jgi:hypothetical protein
MQVAAGHADEDAMSNTDRERRGAVGSAARAVTLPFRVQSRVQAVVLPMARVFGAFGILMLLGCGVLAWTPASNWPSRLSPQLLPIYLMVSLTMASLLGWTFVNDGQARIARWMPKPVAALFFVVLPVICAVLGLVGEEFVRSYAGPDRPWVWLVVHWYGPVLIVLNLLAFHSWKSDGKGNGVLFFLLVLPYLALLCFLVFGVRIEALDSVHRTTLAALGSWALALQLVLAFFVGGSVSGRH